MKKKNELDEKKAKIGIVAKLQYNESVKKETTSVADYEANRDEARKEMD